MLLEILGEVADKRKAKGKIYKLKYILLFFIIAVTAGANDYPSVADYIEENLEKLEDKYGIFWVRSPDESTIRKILNNIDPQDLENAFRKHSRECLKLCKENDIECFAIDGKTLRGSYDNFNDKKASHILKVFSTIHNLIIAHYEIDKKSNEIPAAQKVIKDINFEGCINTMDAMHCQKKLLR
jgi:hypothetical protein